MKQYLNLLAHVLDNGQVKHNRTGIDTISLFGTQTRYDLRDGFPIVTTKKVFTKGIIHELLWFIAGDTNIKYLVDHNVNIWNEWPYQKFQKSSDYANETLSEYVDKVKNNQAFALKHGDLGPVYGRQWRNFNGRDQLQWLLNEIKSNPFSRRLIISAWNPNEIDEMALPPCHTIFQFYVSEGNEQEKILNLQLYQRSADLFLGVPFNIASYALLLELVAKECNMIAGEFIHTTGDTHIYSNHLDQVKLQLTREPHPLPKILIHNFESIFTVKFSDIEIIGYESDLAIKGEVAV